MSDYVKTKTPGLYQRHQTACPARGNGRCRCTPTYRGKRRNPVTGQYEWSKTNKDRAEIANWIHSATGNAAQAIQEHVAAGRTFASLADEWIEGVKAGHIARRRRGKAKAYSPTTVAPYRRDVERLLKPRFGDRPAGTITEREWQELIDELMRSGLSYSRLANIKAVASSIYTWAVHRSRRYVAVNPLAHVELPPNDGKRRNRVALAEEAAGLLAALDQDDRVPYAIAFYAGLRRGEIQRLQWPDIEMIDGKPGAWLTVRPAPGKAADGRHLPIAEPLRAVLLEHYLRAGRPVEGNVCRSVMSGKLAKRAMKAWVGTEQDPLPAERRQTPITLHACRHTYASFLMAAGYTLVEIMEFMGHADLQTTDRYVKVLPQPAETDRSERLSAYFAHSRQEPTSSTR